MLTENQEKHTFFLPLSICKDDLTLHDSFDSVSFTCVSDILFYLPNFIPLPLLSGKEE